MVSRQTAAATGLAGRQPHSTACSPTKEITHASRLDRVGRLFGAGKQPTARPAGDRGRTTLSGANLFKRACTPAFLSLSSSLFYLPLFLSLHCFLFTLHYFLFLYSSLSLFLATLSSHHSLLLSLFSPLFTAGPARDRNMLVSERPAEKTAQSAPWKHSEGQRTEIN